MRARAWFGVFGLLGLILFGGLAVLSEQQAPRPAAQRAGTPSNGTTPARGGKVVYGIESDPNGLDPSRNGWDPAALLVANAIFDPLVAFDAAGQPKPYLLESFGHNEDHTEWTATVRPNVRFHDGTPFDAEAVVRHTNAMLGSAITGPAASTIDRAEAVDDRTVTVFLKRSWASFPILLAGQGGMVASPKQLDDPEGSSRPVGTGPFRLERWDIGRSVTVVRNPGYWRNGLPYLDEVEFRTISEAQKRIDELQNGTLNVLHNSDVSLGRQLDALAGDPANGIRVTHDPGITEANFVMLNTAEPPLDDVRVRRALAHGFDREGSARRNGWPVDRLITDSLFPPGSPWYAKTDYPRYDPAKARQLIAEHEAEHGPVQLTLGATSDPVNLRQAQDLADQWRQIGVDVELEGIEQKVFVIRAVVGQYDAIVFRYFGAADPDNNSPFWAGETIKPPGQLSLNFTRLQDDRIDEAILESQRSPDAAVRRRAYAEVQQRFAELVPYIWTYRTDWAIATSDSVQDARNVTLPDGSSAMPYVAGVHRLSETWISSR
jgi:peptide/nickel transport system substrate-binding protein